jgi:hypothetical protein
LTREIQYTPCVNPAIASTCALGLVVLSLGALGCSSGTSAAVEPATQALAENGTDVVDLASHLASLTASFASSTESTHLKLSVVRASAGPLYAPNGCLEASHSPTDPNELSMAFSECAGPWGLAELGGTLGVVQAGGPDLVFSATSLNVNLADVTFEAQAHIDFEGAARTMIWSGMLKGTTARGRSFSSSVDLTLTWQLGGTCITVDGSSSGGVVAGVPVSTEVKGLVRCETACPTTGSVSVWSPPTSTTADPLELSFTGMDVAYFAAGGGANPIKLSCGF